MSDCLKRDWLAGTVYLGNHSKKKSAEVRLYKNLKSDQLRVGSRGQLVSINSFLIGR